MAAGLFGVFGYDMVRLLEPLGPARADPRALPDAELARPSLIAVFDSVRREIVVVAPCFPDGSAAKALRSGASSKPGRKRRLASVPSGHPKCVRSGTRSRAVPGCFATGRS
jgi:anthranilate synthase component 1